MKTYRVYFNRKQDYPLVWSIDEGTQATETNVSDVVIIASYTSTKSRINDGTIDVNNTPLAWLEVEAQGIRIADGVATIW